MKCINHNENEAMFICSECNQPICQDCVLCFDEEKVCKKCVEEKYKAKLQNKKEGKLSVLFHFFCSLVPGAGQMQQGAMKRGVQIMLSFFTLLALTFWLHFEEIFFFSAVIWFYSFFDSYHIKKARKLKLQNWDREFIQVSLIEIFEKYKNKNWIPWALICLGILALFNSFVDLSRYGYLDYRIANLLRTNIIPVGAVLVGYILLKKSKEINHKEAEEKENI